MIISLLFLPRQKQRRRILTSLTILGTTCSSFILSSLLSRSTPPCLPMARFICRGRTGWTQLIMLGLVRRRKQWIESYPLWRMDVMVWSALTLNILHQTWSHHTLSSGPPWRPVSQHWSQWSATWGPPGAGFLPSSHIFPTFQGSHVPARSETHLIPFHGHCTALHVLSGPVLHFDWPVTKLGDQLRTLPLVASGTADHLHVLNQLIWIWNMQYTYDQ